MLGDAIASKNQTAFKERIEVIKYLQWKHLKLQNIVHIEFLMEGTGNWLFHINCSSNRFPSGLSIVPRSKMFSFVVDHLYTYTYHIYFCHIYAESDQLMRQL